jgi:hypothetical protein
MNATCLLCPQTFEARTSYGLCPKCQDQHTLREYDRLESRIRQARRERTVPITLTLKDWMSIISDSQGLCSFCREYTCSVIEIVERDRGLTYENVVPACRACSTRRHEGYQYAEDRVRFYLHHERVQPRSTSLNSRAFPRKDDRLSWLSLLNRLNYHLCD